MAIFVLVPGAWLGGWCWKRVRAPLRSSGHDVHTPSLTGLGDRVHLGTPDIDLQTHVQDVVNLIDSEDLSEVILVGHSYGGMVITGTADRIPDRLAHLVYLDAFVPSTGRCVFDYFSESKRRLILEHTEQRGDGWRWPLPDDLPAFVSINGMAEDDRRWMKRHSAGQPIKTFTQPLPLQPSSLDVPRTYVVCTAGRSFDGVDGFKKLVSSVSLLKELRTPDWRFLELNTHHFPMFSTPLELANLLNEIAT